MDINFVRQAADYVLERLQDTRHTLNRLSRFLMLIFRILLCQRRRDMPGALWRDAWAENL